MRFRIKRYLDVPTFVQAVPFKALIDKPLIMDQYPPLTYTDKNERLRMYHGRLDLLQAIVNPDQADLDWQVETILEWITVFCAELDSLCYYIPSMYSIFCILTFVQEKNIRKAESLKS